MNQFAVIIPSRNSDNLEACVRAIRAGGETCRIIVIDDGLARRPEECEYVEGVKPFIYARAINQGIRAAGTDDVVLLNDDALLETPGGLSRLSRQAEGNSHYGVLSPAVSNVGNRRQNWTDAQEIRYEPEVLMFVCVYISRSVLDSIGPLDEQFDGYGYDDNDYCLRVRNAGLQLGIWDGCKIDHASLKSSFRGERFPEKEMAHNRAIFERKWAISQPVAEPIARVQLFVFKYRAAPATAEMALDKMIEHSRARGVEVRKQPFGNALIHRSRNMALASVKAETTHVLFVDDDMIPFPDALLKLLEIDRPVITALCTTRGGMGVEPEIAAKVYDAKLDLFGALDSVNITKVNEGPFAPGAAFLLLRKDVIDRLIEHYLSADDWDCDTKAQHVRLHVRNEHREKEKSRISHLRKALWNEYRELRVFDFPVNEGERQLGEDLCLAKRLQQIGTDVVLDGRTQVGHLGEYPYTVWDVIRKQKKDQENAA